MIYCFILNKIDKVIRQYDMQSTNAEILYLSILNKMKMNCDAKPILIASILILIVLSTCDEQPYKKVVHNIDPQAKCIDGSSPALHIHEGGDLKNFLIFFNGGGSCSGASLQQVLQSCYQRSKTDLGSSLRLPNSLIINGGYMSTDPNLSKFATWTKVLINYCDGSFHQGSNKVPIKYKDTELYFRGADNTRSHLQYLIQRYNLAAAERVLLTGTSAGGIATYLWTNYVRSLMSNPAAVFSVPDSGVFLNVPSPKTKIYKMQLAFKNLFSVANANEKSPLTLCNLVFPNEEYRCLFIENVFTAVEGKVLLVNSQYDSEAIPNLLDINCLQKGKEGYTLQSCNSTEMSSIQAYRKVYLNFVNNFLQFSTHNIWTISCSDHVYAVYGSRYDVVTEKIPESTGVTVREAVQKFVFEYERVAVIDHSTWPDNSACSC